MTFYQQQLLFIKEKYFPREGLCDHVVRAKDYIDNNFAEAITLKDVAGEAYCSKFHFLRLFKQLYGRTPHQYLTLVRIENAKQLLKSGMPVADVCFLVGFTSVSSFKGLFKHHTTFTPAAYQKQLTNKQEVPGTHFRFLPLFYSIKKSNIQDRL